MLGFLSISQRVHEPTIALKTHIFSTAGMTTKNNYLLFQLSVIHHIITTLTSSKTDNTLTEQDQGPDSVGASNIDKKLIIVHR